MSSADPLLMQAEQIAEVLNTRSLPAVVIGGLALAAHG